MTVLQRQYYCTKLRDTHRSHVGNTSFPPQLESRVSSCCRQCEYIRNYFLEYHFKNPKQLETRASRWPVQSEPFLPGDCFLKLVTFKLARTKPWMNNTHTKGCIHVAAQDEGKAVVFAEIHERARLPLQAATQWSLMGTLDCLAWQIGLSRPRMLAQ